ncbi:MAG TPA: acyltransferase [Acidimicrobiia bacterium]
MLPDAALHPPPTRDRLVDFVRGASILVVVVGHWLMAVITWDGATMAVDNVLRHLEGAWIATWLLQVMPLFFFVGGFSNLRSLDSAARRREPYSVWVSRRVRRITRPTFAFLAIVLPIVGILEAAAVTSLGDTTLLLTQLFWFFGVYLGIIALAPAMLAWHRRHGAAVLAILLGAAAVGDVARYATGYNFAAFTNFAAVWLFAHQLGYFYAEGRIRRRTAGLMAVGGLLALTILVAFGPYPQSMVGLPGQESNMTPPTLAIASLTVWQAGLILLLRPAMNRWLEKPLPWRGVVLANSVIMTLLLWHLPVLLLVSRVTIWLTPPRPEVGTGSWWLMLPGVLAIQTLVLTVVVLALRRFERPSPDPPAFPIEAGTGVAALGVSLLVLGFLGFALTGPWGYLSGAGTSFGPLEVGPLSSLAYLGLGGLLVRASYRERNQLQRALSVTMAALVGLILIDLSGTRLAELLAVNGPDAVLHGALAVATVTVGISVRRAG